MFSLVITNVPGPQIPLYAAGSLMTEMFPILPVEQGQAVSIGLTSYDGGVYFGLNGDRDAVRDIDLLAELIEESLGELLAAAGSSSTLASGGPGSGRTSSSATPPRRSR